MNGPGPRLRARFWELPLGDLNHNEWEALCDGCGRCCLRKLEDAETGEVAYTRVACRLLDCATAQCCDYANRFARVPDCIDLTPGTIAENAYWMPQSCAYRLRFEGKPLPAWHPLLTGRADTVVEAGISMAGRVISESGVDEDDLEDHVIEGDF